MNRTDSLQLEAVDEMLSRFMKSEMPHPWPKAPSPQSGPITPASSPSLTSPSPLVSSRYSLAASVALILGGCWLLSNLLSDHPNPNRFGGLDGGNASTKHLEKLATPAPKFNKSQP
jgi:hypothetical protein